MISFIQLAYRKTAQSRAQEGLKPWVLALVLGVMLPRSQNHAGHGNVALSVAANGPEGTPGVFGRAQSDPLCDGPSRGPLPRGVGADQF